MELTTTEVIVFLDDSIWSYDYTSVTKYWIVDFKKTRITLFQEKANKEVLGKVPEIVTILYNIE